MLDDLTDSQQNAQLLTKETARCSIKTGHEICWLLAYRIWMKQLLCEPFHLNPCVHFDPGSSWLVWLVPADGRGGFRTSRWIRCSENFWGWDPVIYLPCSEKDVQWPWSIYSQGLVSSGPWWSILRPQKDFLLSRNRLFEACGLCHL